MANAKSLPYAKTGKESVKHVGRVGRANGLAKPLGRRADTVGEKNNIGEWGFSPKLGVRGEERTRLDQGRRVAAKGRIGIAWFGHLAFEFRGNCAAKRIKPLACLDAYGEWGMGNGERIPRAKRAAQAVARGVGMGNGEWGTEFVNFKPHHFDHCNGAARLPARDG